jgi:hypothetical protein
MLVCENPDPSEMDANVVMNDGALIWLLSRSMLQIEAGNDYTGAIVGLESMTNFLSFGPDPVPLRNFARKEQGGGLRRIISDARYGLAKWLEPALL